MKNYQIRLKHHLAAYGRRELSLTEWGKWKEKEYEHIIPVPRRHLNFMAGYREALVTYLDQPGNRAIKWHQCFHHLTSSQAFAFNLFFPYLQSGPLAARSLAAHFSSLSPDHWQFEAVPFKKEGTNVDVSWSDARGVKLYCEVKLSEGGFSTAKDDERHREKLETIYRPWLGPLVDAKLLEPKKFFGNYQILRNIALLHRDQPDELAFLVPKENERLTRQLNQVFDHVPPATRARIRVVYIEELLKRLEKDESLSGPLRAHATALAAKYLPVTE